MGWQPRAGHLGVGGAEPPLPRRKPGLPRWRASCLRSSPQWTGCLPTAAPTSPPPRTGTPASLPRLPTSPQSMRPSPQAPTQKTFLPHRKPPCPPRAHWAPPGKTPPSPRETCPPCLRRACPRHCPRGPRTQGSSWGEPDRAGALGTNGVNQVLLGRTGLWAARGPPCVGEQVTPPRGSPHGRHSPQPCPEWPVRLGRACFCSWQPETQGPLALGRGAPTPTSWAWGEPRWWTWSPPSSPEGFCATRWLHSRSRPHPAAW